VSVYATWDTTAPPLHTLEDLDAFLSRSSVENYVDTIGPASRILMEIPVHSNFKLLTNQPIRWRCSAIPEGYTLSHSYSVGERYVLRGHNRALSILLYIFDYSNPVEDARWEFFDIGDKVMAIIAYNDMDEFNKTLQAWFNGDLNLFK